LTGLGVSISDLRGPGGGKIPSAAIDIRVSRQHQKTMQFGHHNHAHNYEEYYLVRRESLDLYPAAARRLYFDVAVQAKAAPGRYTGRICIVGASGNPLMSIPVLLEVLPIELETPPVWFAGSWDHPRLADYGFNVLQADYDESVREGYPGYIVWLYDAAKPRFRGRRIGWSDFVGERKFLWPIIAAGRKGEGPRGFFGGRAPGTYGKSNAAEIAQGFFEKIVRAAPQVDVCNVTFDAYCSPDGCYQDPHEWIYFQTVKAPMLGTAETLQAAAGGDREFWFIDGLRHSKEQAGRFTFGFWLWRLGAAGRFTSLRAHLQYGGGTAKETYAYEPYYCTLDVTTCNVDTAVKETLTEDVVNPSRDLVLIRAGFDDYRYIHTLERRISAAERAKPGARELAAAKQFRDRLRLSLSLNLLDYYEMRSGSYGENWYRLPENPWTDAEFERVRRDCASHIVALQQILAE
jgi:hypothetical protein